MLNVLVSSNSPNIGSIVTFLLKTLEVPFKVNFSSSPYDLEDMVIESRPDIIALKMQWFLTYGFTLTKNLNEYSIANIEHVQTVPEILIEDSAIRNEKDLYIISIEHLIEDLLSKQKVKVFDNVALSEVLEYHDNVETSNQNMVSPAEKRVLKELVKGGSYKIIACELSLSIETVKTHIRNIYRKLHVNNAASAVSVAIREQLV